MMDPSRPHLHLVSGKLTEADIDAEFSRHLHASMDQLTSHASLLPDRMRSVAMESALFDADRQRRASSPDYARHTRPGLSACTADACQSGDMECPTKDACRISESQLDAVNAGVWRWGLAGGAAAVFLWLADWPAVVAAVRGVL